MKLKPKTKVVALPKENEVDFNPPKMTKKTKAKDSLKNYSDEYKPLFEPHRLLVSEKPSKNDPSQMTRFYLEFKAMRYGDDGLPYVFITTYQESPLYTGYTKKGIHFPLEMLEEFQFELNYVDEECSERGL